MSHHGSLSQSSQTQSRLFALVPIWDSGEQTLLLSQNQTLRAGSAADCDLVIDHPGVALWHATLHDSGDGVTIRPEGRQHVWINDRLVETAAQIDPGDTVAIGPATFRAEVRRAIRRTPARRHPRSVEATPLVSARLEKQLTDLHQQFGEAVDDTSFADSPQHSLHSFLPSFANPVSDESGLPPQPLDANPAPGATPFLDFMATTNRRTALDEREGQLNAWHRSLDRRREELDKRSANLTRQQAALVARQTELDQRTAELETWHQTALEGIEDRKASVNVEAEAELRQRRDTLKCQEEELRQEKQLVAEQLRRMEESRESIAEQLLNLEESRLEIKAERAELAEERSSLDAVTQARQQADSKQQEAFREQRQKLDDFANQLQLDRDALLQQEESLRSEQQRLQSRNQDVAAAEQQLQLAASGVDSTDETAESDSASTEALQLLEEQKQNLAEQQATVQQQLDALERREDELELLRRDVEDQRSLLVEEQVALEFERQEASTTFEEARQLQQDLLQGELGFADVNDEDRDSNSSLQDQLQQREQELNLRTQELANRLADLKTWKRSLESQQLSHSEATTSPSIDEHPQSAIASKLGSLLMPAGSSPDSEAAHSDGADERLDAMLAENAGLQSERNELLDRVAELESQVQAAEQESNSLSSLFLNGEGGITGRALTEQNLLSELQALKSELTDSQDQAEADAANPGEQAVVQSQVAELEARNQAIEEAHAETSQKYEATIAQLNEQLEQVQKQFEDLERRAMKAVASAHSETDGSNGGDSETVATLTQMVEQLSEKLEQRNGTIDNLQAQLNGGVPVDPSASMTPQEVKVLSEELDNRTVLLDERESVVRERERLLEDSQQELQTQSVALQEARQELERARAEVFSVRETTGAESAVLPRDLIDNATKLAEAGVSHSPGESLEQPPAKPEEDSTGSAKSSVRSEIAELFGLGSKAKVDSEPAETQTGPSTAAELMEAVDDYSQESAAAVSLSFDAAEDMLMKPDSNLDSEAEPQFESKEDSNDEASDVVASYMEQLLSRSRAKADGEAPAERKADSGPPKKKVDVEKEKADKQPTGQSASFIDKYMSGQYAGGESTAEVGETEVVEVPVDQELQDQNAELRRSKIDRDALRNDLQSFRELSAQSAANALATHARRQQKGGITTRTTILTTLGLICVLVLVAAMVGVVPFGWLTALSIGAVLVSGVELTLKLKKLQEEVHEKTQFSRDTENRNPVVPQNAPPQPVPMNPVENYGPAHNADGVAPADFSGTAPVAPDAVVPDAVVPDAVVPDAVVPDAVVPHSVAPDAVVANPAMMNQPVPAEQPVFMNQPAVPDSVVEVDPSASASLPPAAPVLEALASTETPPPNAVEEVTEVGEADLLGHNSHVAPEASSQPAAASGDDGVPDAFDQAFRMLTSTTFPVNKPEDSEQS